MKARIIDTLFYLNVYLIDIDSNNDCEHFIQSLEFVECEKI